jgi:hypothetical protein
MPALRTAIREALDKGTPATDLRNRFGIARSKRTICCVIEFLIDEWERDKGIVKEDESIDE